MADVPEHITRRSVFSLCGKLVGHYPVCGWLRVATAFIKRKANAITERWDDVITDEEVRTLLMEVVSKVKNNDPVRGLWCVNSYEAKVWVDASSVAIGVAMEIDSVIVKDASWLRNEDSCHINMAELDAVIKGLNLALAWKLRKVEILTDSSAVHRWISDGISGKKRLKTKAASEMLIRRRVGIVLALMHECDLQLSVTLVQSVNNKADCLTRVPQRWLKVSTQENNVCASSINKPNAEIVGVHHAAGHPGIKRTLYFAKRANPTVPKQQVRSVVANCEECQSVDPPSVKWRRGELGVEGVWQRLGMDITHCHGQHYLTLIDCEPSRFTIWRQLRIQTSEQVIKQLEAIFYERGVPEEILTDNDTAFRSRLFAEFAKRWCVRVRFRCAHVPSGNGIVERCHRTVKVIAAIKRCSIPEAVYLYNVRPQDDCTLATAPANMLYTYYVKVRRVDPCEEDNLEVNCPYEAGTRVWVKPPNARCNERYRKGTITKILSEQAVEVDGMPRHVKDLHPCTSIPDQVQLPNTSEDDELCIRIPAQIDEE